MEVLGVALVEAVLGEQAPVAVTILDPPADAVWRRVDELLGQLGGQRMRPAIADEDPDQTEVVGGRVSGHADLPADRRLGSVGDHRDELAVAEAIGPAVVRAGQRSRELLRAQ